MVAGDVEHGTGCISGFEIGAAMLALLFAKLHEDQINDPETFWYLVAGELLIFDAPMIVILFAMWSSI